jgi:dGTPase
VVDFLERDGRGLNLTREVVDGIINHKLSTTPKTLEGRAVSMADRIAYINHDIDDAIESGFITLNDLPKDLISILGATSSKRINVMIQSIARKSDGKNQVEMEEEISKATLALRKFLFDSVYTHKTFKAEEEKADRMISAMYEYFKVNLDKLPEFYYGMLDNNDIDTVICDYISGMSDGYAVKTFNDIFVPKSWKL